METEKIEEPPNPTTTTTTTSTIASLTTTQPPLPQSPTNHNDDYDDYIDSNCSTPYVSAPSSPGRSTFLHSGGGGGGGGYFYSAPASPMHFLLSNAAANSARSSGYVPSPSESSLTGGGGSGSFEFEFSARFGNSNSNSSSNITTTAVNNNNGCFEDHPPTEIGSMSSADELFLNGQIRPMKLSSHLQRPQFLAPLIDIAESDECGSNEHGEGGVYDNNDDAFPRSRTYWRLRDKSLRRRARSMSPMRSIDNAEGTLFDWCEPDAVVVDTTPAVVKSDEQDQNAKLSEAAEMILKAGHGSSSSNDGVGGKSGEGIEEVSVPVSSASASSSRCSSAGRSSKRWVFLKDFLRSKSEGRNNGKFWSNISFSPAAKEKKSSGSISASQQPDNQPLPTTDSREKVDQASCNVTSTETQKPPKKGVKKSSSSSNPPPTNGIRMGKRRVPLSAHEMHYTANRAQAEEMRKKTYLPYRQGLLGCLGFSSRSYGAMNGFARALNPVSSR